MVSCSNSRRRQVTSVSAATRKPVEVVDWNCNEGEIGVVKSYDQFAPKEWQRSGRYTSINGLVQPDLGSSDDISVWAARIMA